MTGDYFIGFTDTKQQMTAVKYAKLIKQCLLFLVQYDEKMMQTLWKSLYWMGRHRVSEYVINKLICLAEQLKK